MSTTSVKLCPQPQNLSQVPIYILKANTEVILGATLNISLNLCLPLASDRIPVGVFQAIVWRGRIDSASVYLHSPLHALKIHK